MDLVPGVTTTVGVLSDPTEETEELRDGDIVLVYYSGELTADGTVFDANYGSGTPFPVTLAPLGEPAGVIDGWNEGLHGVHAGDQIEEADRRADDIERGQELQLPPGLQLPDDEADRADAGDQPGDRQGVAIAALGRTARPLQGDAGADEDQMRGDEDQGG